MIYILLDFDGTLGYREGIWTMTLYSLLEKNGYDYILMEDVRPFLNIGFPWHSADAPHKEIMKGKSWWNYMNEYFFEIFINVGVNKEDALILSRKVKDEYLLKEKWHLYNDTIPFLNKLKKNNIACSILSNHIPELSEIVETLGIHQYFDKIYSSGNIGYEKPNAYIYKYAINDLNINKNDAIMIGDSYTADVAGALRYGLNAVLVRKKNDKNYKLYSENLDNVFKHINKMSTERPGKSLLS